MPGDFPLPDNNKKQELLPWRHAESMTTCSLFWIPAGFHAVPDGQKEWLLSFILTFSQRLEQSHQLRAEHFMQMQTIDENQSVRKIFLNSLLKETPITGASRRPRQPEAEAAVPTREDIEAFAKGKRQFRVYDYMPANSCWFLGCNDAQVRQTYLGYGGMTILFRKRETQNGNYQAAIAPPMPLIVPKFLRADRQMVNLLEGFEMNNPGKIPSFLRNHPDMKQMFSAFDMDKEQEKGARLLSPFRDQSKQVFGQDMERDLKFEALPFVLPRLSSQDFFSHTAIQIRRWFEVFDVYVAESPDDEGIVMACKDNQTELIAEIVGEMRDKGYRYWEG
jgi:hypothetical protein